VIVNSLVVFSKSSQQDTKLSLNTALWILLSAYRIFEESDQRLMQMVTLVLFADSVPTFVIGMVDPSEETAAYLASVRKLTEVQ